MVQKLFAILIVVVLVVACEKEDENNLFDFGFENVFEINKTYVSNDQTLKFSISEIGDSRCPIGVMCIWEGEAKVTVAFEIPVVDTILLSTYDNLRDTILDYEIQLFEVAPYPEVYKDIKTEDYEVTLRILKLD